VTTTNDRDELARHADEFSVDAPGAEELQVVPWPLLLHRRLTAKVEDSARYPWIVLTTALFGLFSVGFTITVLSNSIPHIANDLNSDASTLTWVVTGPLLAFAVFGPAAGKLADLRGQKRVYLGSLSGVCVFAGLTALAPNAAILIACRTAGAAIGAAEGPASLAIINRTFPRERRTQAMGWWSMVGAGAPVIGVVVGGPVVETFGWRWIFVAQVPLTLITLVVASIVLPNVPGDKSARFDLPGALCLGFATLSLLLAINRAPSAGLTDPIIVAGFALAVVLYIAFFAVEGRVANPLLPLKYVRERNFSFPMATQFWTNFAYMGGFIITPLFLQQEFGYSETQSGVLLIARPLTFAIAGPLAGYCTIWIGERVAAVTGAVCITLSMIFLAHLVPGDSNLMIIFALALSGLGMGAASPAMAASVANSVREKDLAVAGATQQMVTMVGTVVGIQTLQAVSVAQAGSAGGVGAFHDAYLVGAVAAAVGIVCASFVRRTAHRPSTVAAHAAATAD
jgi:EmrB/QacA subfamily drug resistance transporter